MTRQELILIGGDKVRRDESLILSYLQEFQKLFGYKPKCTGCTFTKDWKKFVNYSQQTKAKTITMKTDKTFILKRGQKSLIHTYKIGNRPRRSYGNTMTEEFAIAFLTNGTKEQIAERKKIFEVLPQIESELAIDVNGEQILLSETTHKQLNAYAEANGIDFGDATKVAEKREVIAQTL